MADAEIVVVNAAPVATPLKRIAIIGDTRYECRRLTPRVNADIVLFQKQQAQIQARRRKIAELVERGEKLNADDEGYERDAERLLENIEQQPSPVSLLAEQMDSFKDIITKLLVVDDVEALGSALDAMPIEALEATATAVTMQVFLDDTVLRGLDDTKKKSRSRGFPAAGGTGTTRRRRTTSARKSPRRRSSSTKRSRK